MIMKDYRNRTLRTALVAVLTMLSASVYAENEPVKYIDSDGQEKYVTDYTVLTGDEMTLTTGWYVVNQPMLKSRGGLDIEGDVHIVLCDKTVWSISTEYSSYIPFSGMLNANLTFYAQSKGEDAGRLLEDYQSNRYVFDGVHLFQVSSLVINGGYIEFVGKGSHYIACYVIDMTMNGGHLSLSNVGRGISCHNLHLNGGELNISASDMAVIVGKELSFGKSYCDFDCECSSFAYYGDDDISLSDFMRVKFNDREFIGSAPYDITDVENVTKISSRYDEELALAIDGVDNFVGASDVWFTLAGVRWIAKPTEKGVYIHNGRKVQIK